VTEMPVTTPPVEHAPRPLVPDWLVQSASLGWRLLAVVALGVVALGAAAVLGSVVAAVVLAAVVTAAFDPLTERLKARGRSPNAAAAIVTLTVGAGGLVVIAVLAIVFIPALLDVIRTVEAGLANLQDTLETAGVPPPASTVMSELVTSAADWLSSAVGALVVTVANTVTILLLAFFLLFFMVTDLDRSIDWMLQAALPWQRAAITDATDTARRRLGRVLRETAIRSVILGAVALGLGLLFGVPEALAIALLVLLGGFIPLVGPIVTTAFFAFAVLASAGGLPAIVSVAVLVIVTLALPRLLGRDAMRGHGVHPMVVLVALSIGAIVGGLLGMVLGVPVVLVLAVVGPAVIDALNGSPDDEETEGIVPRWLDRLAQWSVRLLVLFGVVALLLFALGQVPLLIIPLVLAAVAAATLSPGVSAMLRRGLTPTAASLAMTIGGFGAILVVVLGALAALAGPMQEIVANASTGAGRIDELAGSTSLVTIVAAAGPELIQFTVTILGALAGFGIVVVVGSILTFYLLRDGAAGFELVTGRFTSWRHDELEEVARRSSNVLGGYMIGTGVVSIVGAGAQFLLMTFLGLPLAWPLAVLSFLGGYIPYIGPFLTTSIAFLVTVAVGTPTEVAIMFVFTLVINIVQGNIVAPLVYGKTVNIHPAVVLLAIPAGSAIAGIAGMFLAVPVVGILATTWRIVLHVFARGPRSATDQAPG
jgi:predicted PurR-regulated permease PerM